MAISPQFEEGYRKRRFLGYFTSELANLSIWPLKASQKPYRNQRPDTHHAWMGFGMCAQRAYLYSYPPPRRRSQGSLARPSQTQIGENSHGKTKRRLSPRQGSPAPGTPREDRQGTAAARQALQAAGFGQRRATPGATGACRGRTGRIASVRDTSRLAQLVHSPEGVERAFSEIGKGPRRWNARTVRAARIEFVVSSVVRKTGEGASSYPPRSVPLQKGRRWR